MRYLLLLALLLSVPTFADASRQIFLSRHMEKTSSGQDPALSPCGVAQAQAFAAQLKDTPSSPGSCTPLTCAPNKLPKRFLQTGRQLVSYDPRQVDQLITEINNKPGNLLVIGHSNTIPALVAKLTGQTVAPLTEQDYGRIYVLSQQDQQWQLQISQLPIQTQCQSSGKAQ